MQTFALRLRPGQDLRRELESFRAEHDLRAALVITCVGSLTHAALRMANRPETTVLEDDFEIVSLVGTLSPDGTHLHASVSDPRGAVRGGHVQVGCLVRTTAEIVLGELDHLEFTRPIDPETTWDELVVSPRPGSGPPA
jgi:predicted DNA-binding protein with PD1-like motif